MRARSFDNAQVANLLVGPYYNRKFIRDELPRLQAIHDQPVVCHRLRAILESQGYRTIPEIDNKSVYDPAELFNSLARYAVETNRTTVDADAYHKAVGMAFKVFGCPSSEMQLQPLSLDEVTCHVHLTHASGAPEFESKERALYKDLTRARKILKKQVSRPPCVGYHRIQHSDKGPKVRLVWGYPQSMSLIEGQFAIPLIDHFLWDHTPMAFGYNKGELSALLISIKNQGYVYGFDVSKFDASVRPSLIKMAFSIIKTWFSTENHDVLDRIQEYFIHTPIVLPDGNVYKKHRGVPSGSWFTQLIDSIVNYTMVQYGLIRTRGYGVNSNAILVLGDDSVIGLTHRINVHEFVRAVSELGFSINLEKSGYSEVARGDTIHFLGHVWDQGLAHRPIMDLLVRAIYPERSGDFSDGLQRAMQYVGDCLEAWEMIYLVLKGLGIRPTTESFQSIAQLLPLGTSVGLGRFQEEALPQVRRPSKSVTTQPYLAPITS